MDTKTQSSDKIPAVRTYAKDLEKNRKAKGLVVETPVPNEDKGIIVKNIEHKKKVVENIKSDDSKTLPVPKIEQAVSLPPLNSIQTKKKSPTKVISINTKNSSFIVDENNEVGATIITDTKRDRFKLIPAVIDSIKAWFSNKKIAYKAKKTPKYTVPETTRRKGVIQRATGVTGKLATSDFSSIHERIKQRKQNEERSEPSTTWTANTEPGFLLLEGPETAVTNVKVVPKKSFRTTEPKTAVVEEIKSPQQQIIQPVAMAVPVNQQVEINPEPQLINTPTENRELVVEMEPETDEFIEPSETSVKQRFRLLLINTNTLALGVSGLVLALIVTIVYSYFILTREDAYIAQNTDPDIELVIEAPIKLAAGETNDKKSLIKVLNIIKQDSTETTQIAFLFNGYNERLIPPQILMSIMGIKTERSLAQSVSIMRFGFTKNKSPFIIMKVTDEIVAMGGLLKWETTMAEDLLNVFNTEEESIVNANFVDSSLVGTDVRILKNEVGTEKIIYGIKNNTIIITTDNFSFTELAELIK